MTDLILNVVTDLADRPVTGTDTTILPMPPGFYMTDHSGEKGLLLGRLGRFLRDVAAKQAADLGEDLHHAQFVLTADPATVEARGSVHDCEECHAGVRRALRMLEADPRLELLVGQLYWAGR